MEKEIIPVGPHKNFEQIKKIDENGIEYWEARELMPLLGYKEWRKFEGVIKKAKDSCQNSGQVIHNHFGDAAKMVSIGSGATTRIPDYKLSRYACYLIAQNGDPRKQEIANAQTYFAIQARKQELFQQMTLEQKRIFIRGEVTAGNKKLFETACKAGVSNFGKFNNYGYLGLYGMTKEEIQSIKDIGKDDVLDRAGTTELAANLFRITQTDEKIRKDNIRGEDNASDCHYHVGRKVRIAIEQIGGTMPEALPPEKHIKELKKEQRKLLKGKSSKKLPS